MSQWKHVRRKRYKRQRKKEISRIERERKKDIEEKDKNEKRTEEMRKRKREMSGAKNVAC